LCVSQIKEHNNEQKTERERETHFTSLQYMCECEFHKSKQTQFEKIEVEKIEIEKIERERIQDVDWDLCSNTFSSIVQVSLDILEESLGSILDLCIMLCCVCVVLIRKREHSNVRECVSAV
jgi:hypothetical protein